MRTQNLCALFAAASITLIGSRPLPAQAIEWSGMLDVRAVDTNSVASWTNEGLEKQRYDRSGSNLRLGQGILAGQGDINDVFNASIVINAADDRRHLLDLQEAWIGWNPLPSGVWKLRAKAGAFFPEMNREIDYDRLTWTPTRTISASAINSWIGEEFRTKGLEFSATHLGRPSGSPQDLGFTLAVFNGNDPAGSLIAWRGWSIGDRITGLSESLQLADLPVYRPTGPINRQTRSINLFRELDGRIGYYVSANYRSGDVVEASAMHYDNRADPLVVKDGQYGWHTRFDHIGARWRAMDEWEVISQAMRGSTTMGPNTVTVDYASWYLLASHPWGGGQISVRRDHFSTREHDILPSDPNGEHGAAWALAYAWPLAKGCTLLAEILTIQSNRPARLLLESNPDQNERSLNLSLRWLF